jgi:UPF0755 protein
MIDSSPEPLMKKNKKTKKLIVIGGVFFIILSFVLLFFVIYFFSPVYLDSEKVVIIPPGYSIIQAGALLEREQLVHSGHAFRLLAQTQNATIKSGPYLFEPGSTRVQEIINRFSNADYGDVYETITIPEGSTNKQVADIIKKSNFTFDHEEFDMLTKDLEGYLFPDTYNFLPDTKTSEIVTKMKEEFKRRMSLLDSELNQSKRTLKDIIIMASILEKEATGDSQEKKIVSGILWKRLDENMLLQVDAPFQYLHGQVRASDLRKDGPYNTYTRLGLTLTPIGNPGISAIRAAINPQDSLYYFYLHGKDGEIRYARTYNLHINNINQYLR